VGWQTLRKQLRGGVNTGTVPLMRVPHGVAVGAVLFAVIASPAFVAGPAANAGSDPPVIAFDDAFAASYEVAPGAPFSIHAVAPAGVYPVFSPNGFELAYQQARGNGAADPKETNNIVIAGRRGENPRTVLTGSIRYDGSASVLPGLAWSPDGNSIAYGCDGSHQSGNNGHLAQICVVNVDTGKHHQVTRSSNPHPLMNDGHTQRMTWLPGGTKILAAVFDEFPCASGTPAGERCGYSEVGLVNVATGHVSLLTQAPNQYAAAPALSPDGKTILYYENQIGNYVPGQPWGIEEMPVGGGSSRQVLDTPTTGVKPGAIYSPDGKDILFEAYTDQDPYHVQAYLVPDSGQGTPKQMTSGSHDVYDAVWVPLLTTCTVPALKHTTIAKAKSLLRKAACSMGKVSGPTSHRYNRHIVSQSIKPKSDRPAGTRVNVRVQ
jgi:Tol biopolymer transport system component